MLRTAARGRGAPFGILERLLGIKPLILTVARIACVRHASRRVSTRQTRGSAPRWTAVLLAPGSRWRESRGYEKTGGTAYPTSASWHWSVPPLNGHAPLSPLRAPASRSLAPDCVTLAHLIAALRLLSRSLRTTIRRVIGRRHWSAGRDWD